MSSRYRHENDWNRLQKMMKVFHNHFREQMNKIYELSDGSYTRYGLSFGGYLQIVTRLNHELTMHHTIEEQYFFPMLAKKMPKFAIGSDGAHIEAHQKIHDGLERLADKVQSWQEDAKAYSPNAMRECLDSFREVLFDHLEEEENDLSAENMQKYWTYDEFEGLHT